MPNLKARIAALEQRVQAKQRGSIAERLKRARERVRAMTPEERAADRQARRERWRDMPEPEAPSLEHSLWLAARREARGWSATGRAGG